MTSAIGPVMLDIAGMELTAEDIELLQNPAVGGVIFFARNYESKAQLSDLISSIRKINPHLLLAVDQEGGRVQRFKAGFTRLPAMQCFGDLYKEDPSAAVTLAQECGWLMASELLAFGLDFSLAPVLDLDSNYCAAIGDRAFASDPDITVALAKAFILGMNEAGMAATGKHFPGHGGVAGDSHVSSPVDNRAFADIQVKDLKPFAALAPYLSAVMPAHVIFAAVDAKPVGFSEVWLKGVLRQQLGFDGVIFSDDLTMEAAGHMGSYGDRARAAIAAGCDMVIVCNNRNGAREVVEALSTEAIGGSDRLKRMKGNTQFVGDDLHKDLRWLSARNRLGRL